MFERVMQPKRPSQKMNGRHLIKINLLYRYCGPALYRIHAEDFLHSFKNLFYIPFFIFFSPSVVVILSKQCRCQCLLCSWATVQSPPRSSQDCSLCSIIWRKTCCFIKDLSVSIHLAAMAGNGLWAVISTRVSAVTENKWDLWCQPEWHQQHEKQREPRPTSTINLGLEPIPLRPQQPDDCNKWAGQTRCQTADFPLFRAGPKER